MSQSPPLLGYTTQLRSGPSRDPAESSSGSTSSGEQQLTPTATSWAVLLAASRAASAKALPSDMRLPS